MFFFFFGPKKETRNIFQNFSPNKEYQDTVFSQLGFQYQSLDLHFINDSFTQWSEWSKNNLKITIMFFASQLA